MLLGIIGWVVVGGLIGLTASKLINLRGDDPKLGIALSAAGGFLGGWLYSLVSGSPVSGFNMCSLIWAAAVAAVALAVWHVVRSRGSYAKPTSRRSY